MTQMSAMGSQGMSVMAGRGMSVMGGPDIVRTLGRRFRDCRMRLQMTQADVARKAGMSVATVHKFESGAATNISLLTLIELLRTIGWLDHIDNVLPELPPSPYLLNRQLLPKQRIRKKKSP